MAAGGCIQGESLEAGRVVSGNLGHGQVGERRKGDQPENHVGLRGLDGFILEESEYTPGYRLGSHHPQREGQWENDSCLRRRLSLITVRVTPTRLGLERQD